jgi:hypothetical protein
MPLHDLFEDWTAPASTKPRNPRHLRRPSTTAPATAQDLAALAAQAVADGHVVMRVGEEQVRQRNEANSQEIKARMSRAAKAGWRRCRRPSTVA